MSFLKPGLVSIECFLEHFFQTLFTWHCFPYVWLVQFAFLSGSSSSLDDIFFFSLFSSFHKSLLQLLRPPSKNLPSLLFLLPLFSIILILSSRPGTGTLTCWKVTRLSLQLVVCFSFVLHPWHLLSSPLYDVSEHTNHIFSARIWSWQHASVNISFVAELSPVYCCLVMYYVFHHISGHLP